MNHDDLYKRIKELELENANFKKELSVKKLFSPANLSKPLLETFNQSEEFRNFLQILINTISDLIWVKDEKGIYLNCNYRFKESVGKKKNDILGKSDYDLVSKEMADLFHAHDCAVLQSGKPVMNEEEITFANDGHKEYIETIRTPLLDKNNQIIGILGIGRDITIRKKQEQEIIAAKKNAENSEKKSQEIKINYETFFNTIDEFLFVLDEQGSILHFNKTVETRLGYSKEELIGQSILSIHPEEQRNEAARIMVEILNGKAEFCSIPINTKDGRLIPVETRVNYGLWNGKPALFGVTKDITNLKLSEEKFSKIFSLNPTACGLSEIETGKYIEVNEAFYKLFGFTKEELIGHSSTELEIIPEETKKSILSEARNNQKVKNVEAELRAKNGNIIHAILFADNIKIQDINYRFTVVQDITQMKYTTEQLIQTKLEAEQSQKKFKAIADTTPLAIYISKGVRQVAEYINPTFYKLFGYSYNEVSEVALWWPKAFPDPQYRKRVSEEWNRKAELAILNKSDIEPMEAVVTCKDGSKKNILWGFVSTGDENWAFGMDLTAYKNVEKELIIAKEKAEESDRLKTAFLQNMSHEIRTPMNAIIGFSELLGHNYGNKLKLEQFSKIINQRCSDLLVIIDNILDIARIESGQLFVNNENCNLNSLFEELKLFVLGQQSRLNKKNIRFEIQANCDSGNSVIETDKVKLKQIFINLLSNALKFTDNGQIVAGCQCDKNDKLVFFVSDTGIGINEKNQLKIFERFTQLQSDSNRLYGGAGLGLSIAKGLIELLGGDIWIESEVGKGSTFYFSLPYQISQLHENELLFTEKEINMEEVFPKRTILVVEDDTYNAEFIKEILSETGLSVLYAKYGKDAVEIAVSQPLDMVLMDIGLPDISGYEATQQIKMRKPHLKIIAQTAYASPEDKQKAFEAGCSDYISKPLKSNMLLSMIKEHL
jgi:PAS domain S-box-containing protein